MCGSIWENCTCGHLTDSEKAAGEAHTHEGETHAHTHAHTHEGETHAHTHTHEDDTHDHTHEGKPHTHV